MRLYILLLLSFVLISCGKQGGSSSPSSPEQQEGRREHGYIETERSVETELLNVTLSEAVSVSGDRINFPRATYVLDSGQRRSCKINISAGEIWHVRRSGNSLLLELPSGRRLTLHSVTNSSQDVFGSWNWKGNENGMKIQRRYTILPDRIVINQDCEG